ncbi:hypothetical protein LK994_06345 [Ferruginibacter lapsinanis]|uniref:hypothetical protein n=1 Tax=Ferruginibacter lapsinanis TaxID=563172 RepID=UPI001E5C2841|nr:hypothetical protein [Ferruginibacter lapsinanis]UEG51094.1 hypothetical protein LK994_06345 [Ferruginibacter lapsinanis]
MIPVPCRNFREASGIVPKGCRKSGEASGIVPKGCRKPGEAFGNTRRLAGNSGRLSGTPESLPETQGGFRVKNEFFPHFWSKKAVFNAKIVDFQAIPPLNKGKLTEVEIRFLPIAEPLLPLLEIFRRSWQTVQLRQRPAAKNTL